MEELVFTNSRNEYVALRNRAPFVLKRVDGTGATRADVQMQKAPFQDGGTYIDSVLEERDIYIEAGIFADTEEEVFQHRATLSRVFNPKLGEGELRYHYYGEVKMIKVAAVKAPEFPGVDRVTGYQRFLIHLVAADPLWLSPTTHKEPMSAYVGMFTFPLEIGEGGIKMGEQTAVTIINNAGDVNTPVEIEFHGPVVNPEVRNNTTGDFIKVNRSIGSDEKLVLNTAFGSKTVEVVNKDSGEKEDAFHWIDLESVFWQLQVGDNELEYRADEGQDDAVVIIKWRKRFAGV